MPEYLTKEDIAAIIKQAMTEASEAHQLSPEEAQWVRLAIQVEAQRKEFRQAIISKSLASLLWVGLVAVGGYVFDFVSAHWK